MSDTLFSTPPVVLIHGMWSTPNTLAELTKAFESEGHEVHVPCLPLHKEKVAHSAESKARLARTSIQEYLDFLVDDLRHLKSPPIVVGHSMGGLLAQLLASRIPCHKLILLSSAPPAGINGWSWSVVRTFGKNLFLFPLWKHVTELAISNIRYGIAQTQSAEIQAEIYRLATYESGKASFQIGAGAFLKNGPTRVDVEKIQCPVLILGGTEDKIATIRVQRKIAERYTQQAKLVEIEGACHWTVGGSFFPQITQNIFEWLQRGPEERISVPT